MPFKMTARTMLHLGRDLISSDAVAVYELVKNALDAGSPRADVRVNVALDRNAEQEAHVQIDILRKRTDSAASPEDLEGIRAALLTNGHLDLRPPHALIALKLLTDASTLDELETAIESCNYIEVSDTGSGMSFEELEDIYLTVGTPSRLKKSKEDGTPFLGEKGIGRLSVMRLGDKLELTTSRTSDDEVSFLEVDWSAFDRDDEVQVHEIQVKPARRRKSDAKVSGTNIRIHRLATAWTQEKVQTLAITEFSKLADPFTDRQRSPVRLFFNGDLIALDRLGLKLLSQAHAHVRGSLTFSTEGEPHFSGQTVFHFPDPENPTRTKGTRSNTFTYEPPFLNGIAGGVGLGVLKSLGPFSFELYWFNRRVLRSLEDIGTRKEILKLVSNWAGGFMVFRDGYRVLPYGGPDDDWLDIDGKALSAGGYKVNRRQLVGKVSITRTENDQLLDQSNREGLRDCDEKDAFRALLKHVVDQELRQYISDVSDEESRVVTMEAAIFSKELSNVRDNLVALDSRLSNRDKSSMGNHDAVAEASRAAKEVLRFLPHVERRIAAFESNHERLMLLAGTGLTLEIVAHELHRSVDLLAQRMAALRAEEISEKVARVLQSISYQLESLRRRLSVLDAMSASGRQRKSVFDLALLTREVFSTFEIATERAGAVTEIVVKPDGARSFRVLAVRGMILQLLHNLMSNSLYWTEWQRRIEEERASTAKGCTGNREEASDGQPTHYQPRIIVTLDTVAGVLRFRDNGPGIEPALKERVFAPFFSTRSDTRLAPRGLGLYICREVADYHGATLQLDPDSRNGQGNLDTFLLTFPEGAQT